MQLPTKKVDMEVITAGAIMECAMAVITVVAIMEVIITKLIVDIVATWEAIIEARLLQESSF